MSYWLIWLIYILDVFVVNFLFSKCVFSVFVLYRSLILQTVYTLKSKIINFRHYANEFDKIMVFKICASVTFLSVCCHEVLLNSSYESCTVFLSFFLSRQLNFVFEMTLLARGSFVNTFSESARIFMIFNIHENSKIL